MTPEFTSKQKEEGVLTGVPEATDGAELDCVRAQGTAAGLGDARAAASGESLVPGRAAALGLGGESHQLIL